MEKLKLRNKFGYGFGSLGYDIIQAIWGSYLLYFYTDVFGISGAAAGLLLIVARVWDAVNDPMMGMIADRSKVTRFGKFRPYILIMPIPLYIFSILTFTTPDLIPTGKLIWAYVTYIGSGMAFTAYGIPFQAMISTLTRNANERDQLVSFKTFFSTIAYVVAGYFVLPLVSILGNGSNQVGFRNLMIVVSIVSYIFALLCFFWSKEKYVPETQATSIGKMIKTAATNKPLLVLAVCMLINGISGMIPGAVGSYYIIYVVGREDLVGLGLALPTAVSLIGIVLAPKIIKVLGDIKTIFSSYIIMFVCSVVGFIFSPGNPVVFIGTTALLGVFSCLPSIVITSNVVCASDYSEWKTGVRCDGTAFALQNFGTKLGQAVAGGIGGFLLSMTGYVAGAAEQSSATMTGLGIVRFIIPPALGLVIGFIMMKLYPLTAEKKAQIAADLEKCHSEKAGDIK